MQLVHRALVGLGIGAGLMLTVPWAVAQEADQRAEQAADEAAVPARAAPRTLDEILVVAQKKTESVQKVPLSISALDSEFIEDWSVTDINSASLYTPNVQIADAGYYILPRIRGFGTNQNNKAFEPPAGVAIDGIPYTRLEYFTGALFDVQRLEVLRGPQGTTFGKNTTAGLLHIISRDPVDEFEGYVDGQLGEFQRKRLEGAVGGAIVEGKVLTRLALMYDERDGFVQNTAIDPGNAPTRARGHERYGVRAKLLFPDLFGTEFKVSFEHTHFEAIGAGVEIFDVTPAMKALIRSYDAGADFVRANNKGAINSEDFRKVDLYTVTGEWRGSLGEWGLVALGGYSLLKGSAALDIDGTPVNVLAGTDADKSPTITAELRAESPILDGFLGVKNLFGMDLGTSSILMGAYFQRREIIGEGIGYEFGLPALEFLAVGQIDNPGSQFPAILGDILAILLPAVPPLDALPLLGDYSENATQDFDQLSTAYAVFAQFDWDITEKWSLQLGGRLNYETKEASFNQYYEPGSLNLLLPIVGVEEFTAQRKLDETQFVPRVALSYQWTDDIGIFLHWTRGFRGAGFNSYAFRGDDDELLYDAESAEDWGLDIKTKFAGGAARLNVSFFWLTVTDFQVLTSRSTDVGIGLGQSIVENAPKARSRGIEADFTWLVNDWLSLFSTVGVNDTEYLDFTFNGCFQDNTNTDGDADTRCDATGKPFPLTPLVSGTVLALINYPLGQTGLELMVGGGFDYQTEQYSNFALDERYKQDFIIRYRATIGIGDQDKVWSLRVQGENLTDERATIRQGQVNRGYVLEALENPRTVYVTGRVKF